jgi:DNA-binding IclR family transcriptional regulator
VVARSGFPIAAVSRALDSLEAAGMVGRDGQWWVRRQALQPPF